MNKKKLYRECQKEARALFKKSEGVLLVFIILCNLIKRYLVFPLMNRIWTLVLSTMPNQYITNQNALSLLKYPYVPLVGIILVVLFSYITIWQISGTLLCIEYNRQGKPVNLLKLLIHSAKHISHVFKPKNWMMIVFLIVIMPLTDLYAASGMLSTFSVPEYIADFIHANTVMSLLFGLLQLFLFFLSIRWFYVIPGVLLHRKDFSVARKESIKLLKKRYIGQAIRILWYAFLCTIRLFVIPILILFGVLGVLCLILSLFKVLNWAAVILVLQYISPITSMVLHTFLQIAITCYYVVNYAVFLKANDMEPDAVLPDSVIKTKKIRMFHFLRPVLLTLMVIISSILLMTISILFTKNPESVKNVMSDTEIIAHKGYSSKAPENTMEAFRLALNSPSNMLELDIRETKDGVPIVIHNADLASASGVKKQVYDLTLEELQAYPVLYGFSEEEYPDCYVPTLEEVLEEFGGKVQLLIEIKMDDRTPDLPKKIVDLINQYDCKASCMIHSSTYEAIEKVKEIDETIPCGFIIAVGTGSYEALPAADFFSVEHTFVNHSMLNKIHSLGKKVYAWTVNNSASISAMSAMNVDGVITDVPDVVYDSSFTYEEIAKTYLLQLETLNPIQKDQVSNEFENENY